MLAQSQVCPRLPESSSPGSKSPKKVRNISREEIGKATAY